MYQQQKVTIPVSEGGITVKNIKGTGYVYYTTGHVYSPEEKRSNPVRVTIGKQCKDDLTQMIPNEKYGIYFAERIPEELRQRPEVVGVDHAGAPVIHLRRGAFAALREEHFRLVVRAGGNMPANVFHSAAYGITVSQIGNPHRPAPLS